MNTSITLYININESRQRRRVQILKELQSVMEDILKMKKWISPISNKLIVSLYNSDKENTILIKLKTSDYPYSLTFFIPKKVIDELKLEANSSIDPIFILESVYKLARIEYKNIGAKFNKRSSIMFLSRGPRQRGFNQ